MIIVAQIIIGLVYLVLPWFAFVSIVILGLSMVIFLVKPEWCLYVLTICSFVFWNNIGINYIGDFAYRNKIIPIFFPIVIIAIICIIIRAAIKVKRPIGTRNPLNIPIFLLLIYSAVTILWSHDVAYSLHTLLLLCVCITIYYFINFFSFSESLHKKCMWCWLAGGLIVSLITIASVYHNETTIKSNIGDMYQFVFEWSSAFQNRGYSFQHPNYTAMSLNVTISIAIGLLIMSKSILKRILLSSLLFIMFFANCLTFSKGGHGALLVMMGYLFFFSSALRKRAFILFICFVVAFLTLRMASAEFSKFTSGKDPIHDRVVQQVSKMRSVSDRVIIWSSGFKRLKKDSLYLWGLGIGGFELLCAQPGWPHAHSLYFGLYFDFGIIGILFCVALFYVILKLLLKGGFSSLIMQMTYYQTMRLCFTASLLAIAIHCLVDNWYHAQFFWLFGGFSILTFRLANIEASSQNTVENMKEQLTVDIN